MLRPHEVSVRDQLVAVQEADIVVMTHSAAAGILPFMKEVHVMLLLLHNLSALQNA